MCDHRGLPHPRVSRQHRFHLTALDPIPANLDLLIGPAQIVQLPISTPAHHIPGAIHPRPHPTEGTRHKPRPRQPRPPPIPNTHPSASHIQLPGHPHRNRTQPLIQHKQRRPRNRRTDRHHRRTRPQRRTHRHLHGGLGRAVAIDHHPPTTGPAILDLDRAGLTTDHHRHRLQPLCRQHTQSRGSRTENIDLFGEQQSMQILRRMDHRLRYHHQPPTMGQRAPDLPHRRVEGVGRPLRPHRGRSSIGRG